MNEVFEEDEVQEEVVEVKQKSRTKKTSKKKNQNGTKKYTVVVSVIRTWMFEEADFASRGLTGLTKGNQLVAVEEIGEWTKVELPRAGGQKVIGYVETSKLLKVS